MSAQEAQTRPACREEDRSGSVKVPERISEPTCDAGNRPDGFHGADRSTVDPHRSSAARTTCATTGCADRARILPRVRWVTEQTVVRHLTMRPGKRRLATTPLLLASPDPHPCNSAKYALTAWACSGKAMSDTGVSVTKYPEVSAVGR